MGESRSSFRTVSFSTFNGMVRPKKFLGQHFLKDQNIARKIVDALSLSSSTIVEIGPGTGVLTNFLIQRKDIRLIMVEIDRESVIYLKERYPVLLENIIEGDFLRLELNDILTGDFSIIGNFPYHISSQIFFKILDYPHRVKEVVCMLQKEVAARIAAGHGNKTYGILSVLLQAYYDIRLLFNVPPGVFFPPPKVTSAVVRLVRNNRTDLGCDELLFKKVVKQGFQTRRKTLRNALKIMALPSPLLALPVMDKRAEELTVDEFILLTQQIERARVL
jgi:16S rRNA (adenine1518-N6/adenine1519-N6)-dimethyltransferase